MTVKQAVANKTESSMKQQKHYRGVTLQSTGKYGSIIWDSRRKTSMWLGTFNSDIEAAQAFDSAAVRLHGSRAILNFPDHEAGKSSLKGCKLLECSGKRRKVKEKRSTVESTINNAEPMPFEAVKSSSKEFKISESYCCEGKIGEMVNSIERSIDDVEEVDIESSCQENPSIVKNIAIPPQAAILKMTPQLSAANKTESSMKKEKHYRGVKLLSAGKSGAQIHDPKSKAYKWLGTFNTDIEAAKAFDIAAVRLGGSRAIMNFPQRETVKGSKGSEILKSSPKKRKMEEKGRSGEKRYRGVALQSTGKYGANIWDPKRKALLWIGTFNSDIEAAKAFDSAAVRLHRSRAILNFPEHEAAKSSLKGSEILKSSVKKRKMKEKRRSVEKHYRGVKLQSAGKYGAQIHDSKSKAYMWLGTFNSNIEAAKAYDSAALRLRGSRAILNFPELEAGKSSLEGSEILKSSRKKRKMEEKGSSVRKHHRGAYSRSSGKCRAEIRNKGARISLGTFDTETEAAKANDSAPIGLHSSGAALNFPLEVGKSSSKVSETLKSSCRKRMVEEMVKNVDSPIHDVHYKEVEMESSIKERNIEKMVNRVESLNEDVNEVEMGSFCMERKIAEMVNSVENPHGNGEGWNLIEQASKVGHLSRKQALELYLQVLRWDLQDSWLCWKERELF